MLVTMLQMTLYWNYLYGMPISLSPFIFLSPSAEESRLFVSSLYLSFIHPTYFKKLQKNDFRTDIIIAMIVKFQNNFLSVLNILHIRAWLWFRLVAILAVVRHSGSSRLNKDAFNLLHTSKSSYYLNSNGKIESCCDSIQLAQLSTRHIDKPE